MPFSRWLTRGPDRAFDLVVDIRSDGNSHLGLGLTAFQLALADQGFDVIAQRRRLDDIGPVFSARVRIATTRLHSLGHGCDIVLCLDKKVFGQKPLSLQAGSVLLYDEAILRHKKKGLSIPQGVIAYPIPFSKFSDGRAAYSKKGIIGIAVLAHFLGLPPEAVRQRIRSEFHRKHFDAGLNWASTHLKKRDIHALPPAPVQGRHVVMNAHQAMALGFEIGRCPCGSRCIEALTKAPEQWMIDHVSDYWLDTFSASHRKAMQSGSPHCEDKVILPFLAVDDPTQLTIAMQGNKSGKRAIGVVPSDLWDAVKLIALGRTHTQRTKTDVWLMLDTVISTLTQTVCVSDVSGLLDQWAIAKRTRSTLGGQRFWNAPERKGDEEAEVGFVTWGSAQGVVREAMHLCRNFGLKVAALYPKMLWPVPVDDLCRFARTVKKLVVVEPNQSGQYTRLLETFTPLRPCSLFPEGHQPLSPMDIFLKENLGGCSAKEHKPVIPAVTKRITQAI